jgi:capsular exopolysaccharide synthesis family protein
MMYEEVRGDNQAARLEDYLRAVRSRWLVVVAFVAAGVLVAAWFDANRTPVYEATARVALGPTPVGSTNNQLQSPSAAREEELLASNPTAEAAAELIGYPGDPAGLLVDLDVRSVPDSNVLRITYTSPDPELAAEVTNAFAVAYTEGRERAAEAYYQTQSEILREQLRLLDAEVAELTTRVQAADRQRSELLDSPQSPLRDAAIDAVEGELSVLRTAQQGSINQQRDIRRALAEVDRDLRSRPVTAEVIGVADVPDSPAGLPGAALLAAGLLAGVVLGVAAAFVLERLDTSAKDERSVTLALGSNVLGAIPPFGIANRTGRSALVMLAPGRSARLQTAREAFRRLRSTLQFVASSQPVPGRLVVVFTSAHPGEGKSVVTANTAVALAQGGHRVALISADLRRPGVDALLGIDRSSGLAEFLEDNDAVLEPVETDVENLWLFPAGSRRADPSLMLASDRLEVLLKQLREEADFTLIDTPPVLSAADAVAIAALTDGVIVVVDPHRTEVEALLDVRAQIERAGGSILGAVMNRDRRRRGSLLRRNRYAYARVRAS